MAKGSHYADSAQKLQDPPARGFNVRLPKAKTLRTAGHCYCLTRTKWVSCRFLATNIQAQVCTRLGWPIPNWNQEREWRFKMWRDVNCWTARSRSLVTLLFWLRSSFSTTKKKKNAAKLELHCWFSLKFGVWKSRPGEFRAEIFRIFHLHRACGVFFSVAMA